MTPAQRRLLGGVTCLAATIAVIALAEYRGRVYFDQQGSRLKEAARTVRNRAVLYERPVVGEPLDQNAAVWYRLAFSEIGRLPADTASELTRALERGPRHHDVELVELLRNRCAESSGVTVRNALRSTRCDWELDPGRNPQLWRDALVLGQCLVLSGNSRGDVGAATDAYLNALTVASDLAQADMMANVAGLTIAKQALGSLSMTITSSGHGEESLSKISRRLAAMESRLPNFTRGLNLLALKWAGDLQKTSMAEADIGLHFFHSYTVAAWRLSRRRNLFDDLLLASTTSSPADTARLGGEIREQWTRAGLGEMPDILTVWSATESDVDDVSRRFQAVLAGVAIEGWRLRTGQYPSGPEEVLHRLRQQGLSYERSEDLMGYRLTIATGTNKGRVVMERRSIR